MSLDSIKICQIHLIVSNVNLEHILNNKDQYNAINVKLINIKINLVKHIAFNVQIELLHYWVLLNAYNVIILVWYVLFFHMILFYETGLDNEIQCQF